MGAIKSFHICPKCRTVGAGWSWTIEHKDSFKCGNCGYEVSLVEWINLETVRMERERLDELPVILEKLSLTLVMRDE